MTFQLKSWRFLILLFSGFLAACTSQRMGGQEAASPSAGNLSGSTVQLAIWSDYLSKDVLDAFEKKTGIKVSISSYASNEELLAKL